MNVFFIEIIRNSYLTFGWLPLSHLSILLSSCFIIVESIIFFFVLLEPSGGLQLVVGEWLPFSYTLPSSSMQPIRLQSGSEDAGLHM